MKVKYIAKKMQVACAGLTAIFCMILLSSCNQTKEVAVTQTTTEDTTISQTATSKETSISTEITLEKKTEHTTTMDTTEFEEKSVITTKPAETVAATTAKPETTVAPTEISAEVSKSQTAAPIEYEAHTEMPQILFIEMRCSIYPENIVYGYFINNKGEIRYFEYLDEEGQAYVDKEEKEGLSLGIYIISFEEIDFNKKLLKRMYNSIIKNSVDTGQRVEESKLEEMYDNLISIDKSKDYEIYSPENVPAAEYVASGTYGIRKKTDNKNEIVLMSCGGLGYSKSKDKTAKSLQIQLGNYFPQTDLDYIPKLLQNEDEQQEDK